MARRPSPRVATGSGRVPRAHRPPPIPRSAGRRAFGRDPRAYDSARPPYPAALFDWLRRESGLGPGLDVLEIGPGSGIATRELLARGVRSVTAVEADPRFARYLRGRLRADRRRVRVIVGPLETVELPPGAFELACSATAFHWVPERRSLRRIARSLRPGGSWAAWWNVYGDPGRRTRFQRGLDEIYRSLATGPAAGRAARPPFQLDGVARRAALRAVGAFDRIRTRTFRWSWTMTPSATAALFGTFSEITTLPPRRRREVLARIRRLAEAQPGGSVTLPMLTPVYLARRARIPVGARRTRRPGGRR